MIATHTCRAWRGRKGKGEGKPSTGRNVAAQTRAQPTFEGRRRRGEGERWREREREGERGRERQRQREREMCVLV